MQPDPPTSSRTSVRGGGVRPRWATRAGWAVTRPDAAAIVADHGRAARGRLLRRQPPGWPECWWQRDSWCVAYLLPDDIVVHVAFVAAECVGLTIVGLGHRGGRRREAATSATLTGAEALITHVENRGRPRPPRLSTGRASRLSDPTPHRRRRHGDGDDARDYDRVVVRGLPQDVFLVNSTSGTTGMPKCVVHTQNRWMYSTSRRRRRRHDRRRRVPERDPALPFGFGIWTAR